MYNVQIYIFFSYNLYFAMHKETILYFYTVEINIQ